MPRPNTLLIDSEQLESGEALDDDFRGMAADEIDRFRREIMERTGDRRAADSLTDQELLREVMNTVGRQGRLGGSIRCVVSVSMLTEGWDANTVTHVLGVRAFGTQLLCEQVIGRALRRQSYDLNDEGLFNVEYADVLGIPFDFTAKPVVAPPQPPRETVQVNAVRPDRDALEIRFPRVAGYRVELPEERLTAVFTDDSTLVLTPDLVGPSITRNQGIIGEGVNLTLEHLEDMRPSTLLFHLTQRLLYTKWRDAGEAPKLHLFGQLKRITKEWLDHHLVCEGGTYRAQLIYQELADMACNRITAAITAAFAGERPMKAVLDAYNPVGSTAHVRFNTSRAHRWQTDPARCHVNWVVLDSDWEAELCRVAESHPRVKAYVKNHNLGLEVPYRYGSEMRRYLPDFIVLVDDGHGDDDLLHLVVEIKGYRREDAKEKKATMDTYWVPAVNNLRTLGRWAFAELTEIYRIESDFEAKVAERVHRDDRQGRRRIAGSFRLTAPAGGNGRVSAAPGRCRFSGPHGPGDGRPNVIGPKIISRLGIARSGGSQVAPKPGCRVASVQGGLAMNIHSPETVATTRGPAALHQLGDQIAELSAHIEAATARLLDLIREFDARGGWGNGFASCAAWLIWRIGLDPGAAREKVRVARALGTLPRLAQALARGELSYAKVRALTRVATPETEERLLAVGLAGTAAHVERIVRGWRKVDRLAEARETARQHASRGLHVHHDDDGTVVLRGRLTPEVGALLLKALAAARETLYQRRRSEERVSIPADAFAERPTFAQQQADALALLAETALHQEIDPGAPGERYQVVVHVDAPALADPDQPGQSVLEDGVHVSAETSRRLACDASRVVMRHDEDGRVVEIGARTRTIPPALRRVLQHRDHGCRFPGCTVSFGEGHHVRHWAQGGPTTLSNLALLCRRHHRAVHEEGYQVDREPDGALRFRQPNGQPLPEVPPPPAVPADPVRALRAQNNAQGLHLDEKTTRPGWLGERLDLGWAISVLHPLATRHWRSDPSPGERGSPAPSASAVAPAAGPPMTSE